MIKAKAKAERSAAKQAAQASGSAPGIEGASTPAAEGEGRSTPVEVRVQESDDTTPAPVPKETPTVDRVELLRSNPEVVNRFMTLLVPILVDVYAASVIIAVRVKTLNGLLKAVTFLDAEGIQKVLKVRAKQCLYQAKSDDLVSSYQSPPLRHLSCLPATTRPS
jgi:E3 ubiquitin-protein ligase TRIP12